MKNKILPIFIFALCFLFFSETKAQTLLQNGEIPTDLIITLERTYCFGDCPVYKLTINANGSIEFEGKEYTKKIGAAKSKLSKEKLKQLLAEFEKSGFFSLRDEYESDSSVCEMYVTDMPSEIISIQINSMNKRVNHNFGCGGEKISKELDRLILLGNKIDEITNSKRWVGKQKKDDDSEN